MDGNEISMARSKNDFLNESHAPDNDWPQGYPFKWHEGLHHIFLQKNIDHSMELRHVHAYANLISRRSLWFSLITFFPMFFIWAHPLSRTKWLVSMAERGYQKKNRIIYTGHYPIIPCLLFSVASFDIPLYSDGGGPICKNRFPKITPNKGSGCSACKSETWIVQC